MLKALDPEKRKQVLAALPPNVVAYIGEFKKEAEEARKMQQEEIQKREPPPQPAVERTC